METAQTKTRTALTLAAMALLTAACWITVVRQLSGMNRGVATGLGSFEFFILGWVVMMGAMMLPGVVPAVLHQARSDDRTPSAAMFVGSYLALWALLGVVVYLLYRPHGTVVAGVLVIAAGLYELTSTKQRFRERCRQHEPSGFRFGLHCAGATGGLMLVLIAVGIMNLSWMTVVAVLCVVQKIRPPRAAVDIPIALSILAFGVLILLAPSSIPGLVPTVPSMPSIPPMPPM